MREWWEWRRVHKRSGERWPHQRRQTGGMQPVPSQVQEHTSAQWTHAITWRLLQEGIDNKYQITYLPTIIKFQRTPKT